MFDPSGYPGYAAQVLRRLTESGYAAFFVGGCVRDAIMGRTVHDWDVATSAEPREIAGLFKKAVMTGERFGTVTVIQPEGSVEVTTFRRESGYEDARHPGSVEFVKRLDDDLRRRDFTINAIAASINGEIIDLYEGEKDINSRVIRCVGDPDQRFSEDALRMFRAYRFRAELGFEIEPLTQRAIINNLDKAKIVSAERIRVELEKTILSQKPETAGEIVEVGLLDKYLAAAVNYGNTEDSRGNATFSLENLAKLKRLSALPAESALRWCAFCAILLSSGHIEAASKFLRDLRLDGKTIRRCSAALSIPGFPDNRAGIKHLLAKHGTNTVRCSAAARDTLCKEERENAPMRFLAETDETIASGECFSLSSLDVTGDDLIAALGHIPGRKIGDMLDALLSHVIENPEDNKRETLLNLSRSFQGENERV